MPVCDRSLFCGRFGVVNPGCALYHHAIPVRVFECAALPLPIGIERADFAKACRHHRVAALRPIRRVGHVEDEEIFLRGRRGDGMQPAVCEFEMVRAAGFAEHDSIESRVVFEVAETDKSKPGTVHCFGAPQVCNRPGDSQLTVHRRNPFG